MVIRKYLKFNSNVLILFGIFLNLAKAGAQENPNQLCVRTSAVIKTVDDQGNPVEIPANKFLRVEAFDNVTKQVMLIYEDKPLNLKGKFLKWASNDDCLAPHEKSKFRRFQNFSFYFGYVTNGANSSFDNILSKIPNPSSVSALPNPIVEKISSGTGWELGACLKSPLGKTPLSTHWCGYYQTLGFEATERPNPNPPSEPTTLNQLSTAKTKYDYQKIGGIAEVAWSWLRTKNNQSNVGIFLNANYFLTQMKKFEYRTGTVFKAESNTVETGPNGASVDYGLSAEYIYFFNAKNNLKNLGLKLEYNINNTMVAKVSFGF